MSGGVRGGNRKEPPYSICEPGCYNFRDLCVLCEIMKPHDYIFDTDSDTDPDADFPSALRAPRLCDSVRAP
jgi:hypothetical protein